MHHHRPLVLRLAAAGVVLLAALLVVALDGLVNQQAAVSPLTPAEAPLPRTPVSGDIRTLLAGQQLARFHCLSCHSAWRASGPRLGGDQRDDAGLYQVIAAGGVGGAGHAFGGRLTDAQIWQLVSYLRAAEHQPAAAAALPAELPPTSTPPGVAPGEAARIIPDRPEPLPPLVFAHRGVLWHSPGADAPLQRLTPPDFPGSADQPVYAPVTGRVAFVSLPPAGGGDEASASPSLFTVALDGSDLRPIWQAAAGDLFLPAWTPDGAALLVTYRGPSRPGEPYADWRPQIVRVDVATGAQRAVVHDAHSPALSPDGRQLAFLRITSDARQTALMVADADGSNARELLSADHFAGFFAPRFAPDGRTVVVAAIGGPPTDATGVPVAQGDRSPVGWLLDRLGPPVAEAHITPPWHLWVVGVDGGGVRRLAALNEDLPMAAFAPDGAELVVMGVGGMYRMRADGADIRRIGLLGDHGAIDWVR